MHVFGSLTGLSCKIWLTRWSVITNQHISEWYILHNLWFAEGTMYQTTSINTLSPLANPIMLKFSS